jgi:hypothetical protein
LLIFLDTIIRMSCPRFDPTSLAEVVKEVSS